MAKQTIFAAYSREDKRWQEWLKDMAAPLEKTADVTFWSDADIIPGQTWEKEISKALDAADVAIMLVSDSFLKSHFISTVELPYILNATKFNARARVGGRRSPWIRSER